MKLTSWGKYPYVDAEILKPNKFETKDLPYSNCIARGLGRSYGDSALAENVILSERLNRFILFDSDLGLLTCDAGVSLKEILEAFVQKGWFLAVTPGTKFVTVGGAIASDVHGKNHHSVGSFSDHVESFTLVINNESFHCSKDLNSDLFYATCGGMGLTGIIIEATIKLKPICSAYINQKTVKAESLEVAIRLFDKYESYTYSVAWIDCLSTGKNLGRSLLMLGEHAEEGGLVTHSDRKISMPCNMPSCLLNKYSIQAFNSAYYSRIKKNEVNHTIHYDSFFYPLDGVNNWNRMYGKNGFTQYQFVLPKEAGIEGLKEILTVIAESKQGSFLAVLKVFGDGNKNLLSFPREGYTLALDFKLTDKLFSLLEKLDAIVRKFNGRLYLSKDVRMSEDMFKATYPQWEEFKKLRSQYGSDKFFNSLQSKRIGL